MKLIILCLSTTNKPSPIYDGVAVIRINSQPCKGINLATWHTQARGHQEWQQFMMWSTSQAESYLALVPFSTRMPRQTHRRWLEHYPIVYPWSEVRYHPTHGHTMLLSLGIPYVPYASVHSSACSIGLNRCKPSSTQAGATTLELQIYDPGHSQPSHPVFSIFP
jgi:hypothetical protein